jgi:uncharacterized Zn finger protein
MSFYGWKPYVSTAQRRKKAEAAVAKARKAGATLSPVTASRGALAKTFWGKAWCDNLERYSDFANRLPRGRTYVRNGSVIDLKITEGKVQAQVMGSSLYKVAVGVIAVPAKQWQCVSADCAGSIDSLVELLQGQFSKAVMERICRPSTGLFPAPQEIEFSCSCPDWASMCKHVAAVLYGVGARLDEQPELMFTLRRVDAKDLVGQAGAGLPKSKRGAPAGRVLDDARLADVFGIEMADVAPVKKPATHRNKRWATRVHEAAIEFAATPGGRALPAGRNGARRKTTAAKKPARPELSTGQVKPATSKAKTAATKTSTRDAATTRHVAARLPKKKSR